MNDKKVYAHSLLLDQLEALVEVVDAAHKIDSFGYSKKSDTERLAAILNLAFEEIPQDLTHMTYRQGDTLGEQNKHW